MENQTPTGENSSLTTPITNPVVGPSSEPPKKNTLKYALIALGVLVIGTLAYVFGSGQFFKGFIGLGEPDIEKLKEYVEEIADGSITEFEMNSEYILNAQKPFYIWADSSDYADISLVEDDVASPANQSLKASTNGSIMLEAISQSELEVKDTSLKTDTFYSSLENLPALPENAIRIEAGQQVRITTQGVEGQNVLHLRSIDEDLQWDFDIVASEGGGEGGEAQPPVDNGGGGGGGGEGGEGEELIIDWIVEPGDRKLNIRDNSENFELGYYGRVYCGQAAPDLQYYVPYNDPDSYEVISGLNWGELEPIFLSFEDFRLEGVECSFREDGDYEVRYEILGNDRNTIAIKLKYVRIENGELSMSEERFAAQPPVDNGGEGGGVPLINNKKVPRKNH